MKKCKRILALMSCVTIMAACNMTTQQTTEPTLAVSKTPLSRSESLLHTAVQLQIFHEGQEAAMEEAYTFIKEMEQFLSTNLEGSDVYKVNQAAGIEPVKVQTATYDIVKQAQEMSQKSEGKFDITIGAVTNLWRIGSTDARKPDESEIKAALPKIDYRQVELNDSEQTIFLKEKGMVMELGGISKGYIADGVKRIFEKHGITTALINLGGNVVAMGSSPSNPEGWNVGVQDPDEVRGEVVGSKRVIDGTVVTSGVYERFLEVNGVKYHHIIDPQTGYPLDNEISGVTIFTQSSIEADAYSTSMFLFGIEKGLAFIEAQEGVEAVFIDKNQGVHLTSGLKDTFKLTNKEYHIAHE